jgi:hypothetical protein
MTAAIKVGDLVRPKLIVAGKHPWLVIGEEIRVTNLRYLMLARGSSKMQLFEDDLEKVPE